MDALVVMFIVMLMIVVRFMGYLPSDNSNMTINVSRQNRKIGLNEAGNKETGIFMYYVNLVRRKYAT